MFSVMFSRDEYFVYILLSTQIPLVVDEVHIAVIGDASYNVTDTRPTTNVGMRCSPDWDVHQLIKPFTDDISVPRSYDTSLYLNGLS